MHTVFYFHICVEVYDGEKEIIRFMGDNLTYTSVPSSLTSFFLFETKLDFNFATLSLISLDVKLGTG